MATANRQSQFYRRLPLFLFVTLIAGLAHADANLSPSYYNAFKGDRFFLLSETSFDSESVAAVRLEAPGRGSGLEEYSGADILVYKVPEPVEFLKKQKNLHRIQIEGNYKGEGLANTLRYVWDTWYKKSRLAWQRVFSFESRKSATKTVPALSQTDPRSYSTQFEHNPQFEPLEGFELVDRFRYPLWKAKPIEPPKETKLLGSSSDFMPQNSGNVMIPIGKRKPGLYLVEAIIGTFRATTLVFVSDNVAVSKLSGEQLLVWMANRKNGAPVNGAKVLLTDGAGTLASGTTDDSGMLVIKRKSPSRSYVIGADKDGGVFVSENFYYDSEIYDTKLYTFTDRPLYRPGDFVSVKLMGRQFQDARRNTAMQGGKVQLTVQDPNGTPIISKTLSLGADGADSGFRLPDNATAGGYALNMSYGGSTYAGAFRVVEYVKPHYEINITLAKANLKTGEPVKGKVRLTFPDGKPVKNAQLQLSVRSQKLTMVDGEMRYEGRFPVKLASEALSVNGNGEADFELPAATEPSRYIFTVLSTDSAAYRVTANKEILIQAGVGAYAVETAARLSAMQEATAFTFRKLTSASDISRPVRWEAIRLEDQSKTDGAIPKSADRFDIRFAQSGSYTIILRDEQDRMVGSTSHWVAGPGLTPPGGSISVVLDKDEYVSGATAKALITFSEPVDQALITLERDRVESYGLLTRANDWIKLEKISASQWKADIPVRESYVPNITFSVLYVKNGNWVFQNKGIKVTVPTIAVNFKTDKAQYLPGEKVTVDVSTTFQGRPVSANVAVSVVDEMVYVLQPEIAPSIVDFFYHPRRNSVRTSASLSFHTYDMALSATAAAPSSNGYRERGVKTLERPRRENIDTAAWMPSLKTDAQGKARFTFVMPDSLSRWRLTGRAMAADGTVGQRTAYVVSSKDVYLKWTGPAVFRKGDKPAITLVAFNQTTTEQKAEVVIDAVGVKSERKLDLAPGANYVKLDFTADGSGPVTASVRVGGKEVDKLQTQVGVVPPTWMTTRSLPVTLSEAETDVKLPPEAGNVRLSFSQNNSEKFMEVLDGLLDYPYGCVEQTSSRLIPLSLAFTHAGQFGLSPQVTSRIENHLAAGRLRLVEMAGPNAKFGWWGDMTGESAFMTAYAYYADWRAAKSLGITLPADHWNNLLTAYKDRGDNEPLVNKAIILWLASEMGLPTRTLVEGALEQAGKTAPGADGPKRLDASMALAAPEAPQSRAIALVLLKLVADKNGVSVGSLNDQVAPALQTLAAGEAPFMKSLSLLAEKRLNNVTDAEGAKALLARLQHETPTLDRALALVFINEALGFSETVAASTATPGAEWRKGQSRLGRDQWVYGGKAAGSVRVKLDKAPEQPLFASVSYDSYEKEASALPIAIERTLYRLKPGEEPMEFAAQPMDGWDVSASELYLDEIVISPKQGKGYRYGLLEVALPPGADVETTTWGMQILYPDNEGTEALEKARHNPSARGYSVPIEALDEPIVIRHLVRFSQRGRFTLPMARYFRMYDPNQKAFEGGDGGRTVQVSVE